MTDDPRELDNRLIERIYHDLSRQRLRVPSLPEVTLRLQRALESDEGDIAIIADIVKADPALAARLIRTANSAFFRGTSPIYDCERAITRLGLATTRSMVTAIALRGLFRASSPMIRARIDRAWRDSVHIAALSGTLARIQFNMDLARAILAGLVHDIGLLPILRYADEYPALIADEQALDAAIGKMSAELGVVVLRAWQFDDALVEIPIESLHWTRDPAPQPDYADVVMIARLHSRFLGDAAYDGPPLRELPAFRKLGLDRIGPTGSILALLEAKEEMTHVRELLGG